MLVRARCLRRLAPSSGTEGGWLSCGGDAEGTGQSRGARAVGGTAPVFGRDVTWGSGTRTVALRGAAMWGTAHEGGVRGVLAVTVAVGTRVCQSSRQCLM